MNLQKRIFHFRSSKKNAPYVGAAIGLLSVLILLCHCLRKRSRSSKKAGARSSIGARLAEAVCGARASGEAAAEDAEADAPEGPSTSLQRSGARVFEQADLSVLASCDNERPPCITNPRIWWRHPALRLAAVWSILFLDFYIYTQDPVQDSYVRYPSFGVFEDLFIIKWPASPALQACRIVLSVAISLFSLWFGRQVIHHKFLRDFLGLQMFSENNGTLLVMFLTWVAFFEYCLPYPINLIETGTIEAPITEDSSLTYATWGKIWQSTAAIADMVSIITITDVVLQDRVVWPHFGVGLKRLWNDACGGWVRVLVAWFGFLVALPLIIYGLHASEHTNGIYSASKADSATSATTQAARVGIAALLTIVDITTCLQDWEFPSFNTPIDFKVTGTFLSELDCPFVANLLRPLSSITCIAEDFWDVFHFRMSGKWIALLPAFGALGCDWWYTCVTIFGYEPANLGQYERPDDCAIFVIRDQAILDAAYDGGELIAEQADLVSWNARQGALSDVLIHSRYCNEDPLLSYLFVVATIAAGIAFAVLILRAELYWDRYAERHVDDEGLMTRIELRLQQAQEIAAGSESQEGPLLDSVGSQSQSSRSKIF